jgi:hypothetical protein
MAQHQEQQYANLVRNVAIILNLFGDQHDMLVVVILNAAWVYYLFVITILQEMLLDIILMIQVYLHLFVRLIELQQSDYVPIVQVINGIHIVVNIVRQQLVLMPRLKVY